MFVGLFGALVEDVVCLSPGVHLLLAWVFITAWFNVLGGCWYGVCLIAVWFCRSCDVMGPV